MKRIALCLTALSVVALAATPAAANLFANPGFEDPITMDGPPFVGFWEGFSGGAGASASNSSVMPRSGAQHLDLSIVNVDNTFAGVFQDVPSLTPGTEYIFSGWHKTPSDPFDVGVEIRIEWRNSGTDTEVSRTPNFTPIPTSDYTQFALTAMVPAGADTARAVYAIQSFGSEPTNTGTVYVDDVSFAIPEPATVALLGLTSIGLAGWCGRRRRTT